MRLAAVFAQAVFVCLGLATAHEEHGEAQEDAAAALFRWVAEKGGKLDGLALRREGLERGLVAQRDLPEGHEILKIPVQLVVTPPRAASSPLGKELAQRADAEVQDLDGLLLAAWLLQQRHEEEPWTPYLDSLPASFPSLGLNLSEDEARICAKGLPDIEKYLVNGIGILEKELRLLQTLPGGEQVEWEHFLWARYVTFSRTFTVSRLRLNVDEFLAQGVHMPNVATFGSARGEAAVLIPLADMLNHARNPNCHWTYATDGFSVTTAREVEEGEELFITYGSKENKLFLAHYGFVDAGSPGDKLEVPGLLGDDRDLSLVIKGSEPANIETIKGVLQACRAKGAPQEEGKAAEVAALKFLLSTLDTEAKHLEAPEGCPAACQLLRNNLLALYATWGHFAEKALGLLVPDEYKESAQKWKDLVGPYLLHSRLYFGIWFRTLGAGKMVDDRVVGFKAILEAGDFGRVSYSDVFAARDEL